MLCVLQRSYFQISSHSEVPGRREIGGAVNIQPTPPPMQPWKRHDPGDAVTRCQSQIPEGPCPAELPSHQPSLGTHGEHRTKLRRVKATETSGLICYSSRAQPGLATASSLVPSSCNPNTVYEPRADRQCFHLGSTFAQKPF